MLASKHNRALYIGVMSNLVKQVWEHKNKVILSFILKHNVQKLVCFKKFQDAKLAFNREKLLKARKENGKLV